MEVINSVATIMESENEAHMVSERSLTMLEMLRTDIPLFSVKAPQDNSVDYVKLLKVSGGR